MLILRGVNEKFFCFFLVCLLFTLLHPPYAPFPSASGLNGCRKNTEPQRVFGALGPNTTQLFWPLLAKKIPTLRAEVGAPICSDLGGPHRDMMRYECKGCSTQISVDFL